jgi:hypothetical protein
MTYYIEERRRRYPLRFSRLSFAEQAVICTGCGGKGGFLNPPDFMFTASCNHHDFNYWIGGKEADRKRADRQFLHAMYYDADGAWWFKRWFFKSVAYTYYLAVRLNGWRFFHYGEPRDWDDLAVRMEQEGCSN